VPPPGFSVPVLFHALFRLTVFLLGFVVRSPIPGLAAIITAIFMSFVACLANEKYSTAAGTKNVKCVEHHAVSISENRFSRIRKYGFLFFLAGMDDKTVDRPGLNADLVVKH
jgi:hypothetical protein